MQALRAERELLLSVAAFCSQTRPLRAKRDHWEKSAASESKSESLRGKRTLWEQNATLESNTWSLRAERGRWERNAVSGREMRSQSAKCGWKPYRMPMFAPAHPSSYSLFIFFRAFFRTLKLHLQSDHLRETIYSSQYTFDLTFQSSIDIWMIWFVPCFLLCSPLYSRQGYLERKRNVIGE